MDFEPKHPRSPAWRFPTCGILDDSLRATILDLIQIKKQRMSAGSAGRSAMSANGLKSKLVNRGPQIMTLAPSRSALRLPFIYAAILKALFKFRSCNCRAAPRVIPPNQGGMHANSRENHRLVRCGRRHCRRQHRSGGGGLVRPSSPLLQLLRRWMGP